VLEDAGLGPDTVEVVFTGADHGSEGGEELDYARSLPVSEAMRPEVLLAYEINGRPLEPQHGFPLRLLVPGWYRGDQRQVAREHHGLHPAVPRLPPGRRLPLPALRGGPRRAGEPHPPPSADDPAGLPRLPREAAIRRASPVGLRGRAWSGSGPIVRVEAGVDGEWFEAELGEPVSEWAWRAWRHEWHATAGEHALRRRATDATGTTQPLEQPWNFQGVGNNLAQEVHVTVRSAVVSAPRRE
jgi:Oxidoreductase molybdopterin binding domain/Mo-co oxidoreductase dimerisation domain